ncbi:MAG: hypothetical protein U0228_21695 [Myxococcaceae bacterium]
MTNVAAFGINSTLPMGFGYSSVAPRARVVTTATQKVMATLQVQASRQSSTLTGSSFRIAVCYEPTDGGAPVPFPGSGLTVIKSPAAEAFTAAGAATPGEGTWDISFCGSDSASALTVWSVNGVVIVAD